MKRTINEIYELIKQKKENAERDIQISFNTMEDARDSEEWLDAKMHSKELKGEIEAYTDVICLIESSMVLEVEDTITLEERIQGYRDNLDKVFPIGSVYIGDENKNPEEIFFGGKWEKIGAYIYKGLCFWKRIA